MQTIIYLQLMCLASKMDSYPAHSFFNNFTNLFNRTENTEDTPVLSSFRSLSEKNTEPRNISVQNHPTFRFDDDSPVGKDLKATDDSSPINRRLTSEMEVVMETEVVLAKAIHPGEECNNQNTLAQRSSLEHIGEDNNVETYINTSINHDKVNLQETLTHTGKEFMDQDQQVNMDQGNSWKDSSLTCQGDQSLADGRADLLSNTLNQEYNDARLNSTAPAERHRSGKHISEQTAEVLPDKDMRDGNPTITKEELSFTAQHVGKHQEWINEVQHPSCMDKNETCSKDIDNPISTIACSDRADDAMSTFKRILGIHNGDIGANTTSDTDINKLQPEEEFWSSLSPDTFNGRDVESERQSTLETGDAFLKVMSDQVLLKLEATAPDSLNETPKWSGTNIVQGLSMLEMKNNGGQDRETMMKEERDNVVQTEEENKEKAMKEDQRDIFQENSNSVSSGVPSAPGNLEEQSNNEKASRATKRVTFSPGLKLEKPLPNIFTGMKGLKKEGNGQQKKVPRFEQPKSPVLLKQASVKRTLFSEKHSKSEVKGNILEQLSQLLSFDAGKVGAKRTQEPTASPPISPSSVAPVAEMPSIEESVEGPDVASSEESGKLTSTETALSAFKAFFTPKPVKTDNSDLDAVKRAFNPETIRAIFDRNSSKSPDNRNIFNTKVCTKKLLQQLPKIEVKIRFESFFQDKRLVLEMSLIGKYSELTWNL